ncbi:MAG: DUF1257 domain-containing protein [Candidatus Sericytochromatia bacterium]|nr:DUF1257 domain-containing protein [Candidatus Sericytochromatia bacterium]
MSAYMTLLTPMTDQECLLAALADLGFDGAKVEVHATPVNLVGYAGDLRAQTANIVIRRKYVGAASNDLGFLASATGYQSLVSGYDHPNFGTGWLTQLNSRYQSHWTEKQERLAADERRRMEDERQRVVETQRQAVHERAKKMGYEVQETREGDAIRLVLVRRTY